MSNEITNEEVERLRAERDELASRLAIQEQQTEDRVQDVLRLLRERDEARARSEYWKAEHLAVDCDRAADILRKHLRPCPPATVYTIDAEKAAQWEDGSDRADIDRIAREGAELAGKATQPPWSADDSAECWRLHGTAHGGIPEQRATLQILKAPKHGTPYAEYWPNEHDAALILHAVNSHAALCRAVIERGEELTALRARVAEMEGALTDFVEEWDDTYDVDEPDPGRLVPNQPMDLRVYRKARVVLAKRAENDRKNTGDGAHVGCDTFDR